MNTETIKEVPMSEARKELKRLAEFFSDNPGAVAITRRGKPVLALLPWDLYASIVETLDVISDKALMARLRKGIREAQQGKLLEWTRAKRLLMP